MLYLVQLRDAYAYIMYAAVVRKTVDRKIAFFVVRKTEIKLIRWNAVCVCQYLGAISHKVYDRMLLRAAAQTNFNKLFIFFIAIRFCFAGGRILRRGEHKINI